MESKMIYLLEDDTDIRHVVKLLLLKEGYGVTAFSTIESFKQQLATATPDLFILDINLPDGNGVDIRKELSDNRSTFGVPVMLMSAGGYENTPSEKGQKWNFIAKPFIIRHFTDMVSDLIGS